MNLQKERQDFELLPDIRGIIQDGFQFNSELNQYFHLDHVNHRLSYAFLMGAWQAWLAAKAQAVPEGFVLVPKESLKVALSWMDEDIDPWQMGANSFAELYEHKPILEKAMIEAAEKEMGEAQEQGHDDK